jgi:hypothetical protein
MCILASLSSSIKVLEIISDMPLAAMEPGATSSTRRPTDVEDEDFPLQQSAHSPPPHDMVDPFLEDSASEAEGDAKEEIAEEMEGDDEDIDDGGLDVEEPEQLPIKLQGC